jgi:hypothetical protein
VADGCSIAMTAARSRWVRSAVWCTPPSESPFPPTAHGLGDDFCIPVSLGYACSNCKDAGTGTASNLQQSQECQSSAVACWHARSGQPLPRCVILTPGAALHLDWFWPPASSPDGALDHVNKSCSPGGCTPHVLPTMQAPQAALVLRPAL